MEGHPHLAVTDVTVRPVEMRKRPDSPNSASRKGIDLPCTKFSNSEAPCCPLADRIRMSVLNASMTPDPVHPPRPSQPSRNLEREESQLWRWALFFMILLSVALAGLLWERLETIPYQLRAIPVGILALSILFAVYAYGRRREVSDLKNLLQGLQEHVGAAPSEEQLDQLSQVIMRSQRSFKELIDSFDDAACAASLDGTLRTVNKRVTELLGLSYAEVVGHKIYEFLDQPTREIAERSLGRFLEKKHWAGTVQVRLKNNARPLYFDCVLNGIVKGD